MPSYSHIDPKIVADGVIARDCHAVVYAPRTTRKRFPANCVEVMESMDAALDAADPAQHRYAAQVIGPSRSSEGQQLFYLVRWLSVVA